MEDQRKTKAQIIEELEALRDRVQELEAAEKELKENCEVFRNIFELAPHLASITRIQDGRYLQVNEAFCRLTGYSLEEIIGRTPFDLNLYADPIDRQRLLDALSQDGRVEGMEIKFKKKDGTFFYTLFSARPYHFKGEDCLLLMATEVTSLKLIEATLRESEEKYRSIIENMEEGYYEVDLRGTYTFVNPAVCRYHGTVREELIELNYRDFMSPETARKVYQLFNEVYRTGVSAKAFEHDMEIIRPDGKKIPLDLSVALIRDVSGKTIGFRGLTYDATERKRIEAERERYRDFVENVEDGCFEVDLTGNITFCNDADCRIFGYNREEFMGMNNRQYTSPETAEKIYKAYNEVYRTGLPAKSFEYEIINKEGLVRYLSMSVSLILDVKGNPVGFRGIDRDVTEHKKVKADLERYRIFVENVDDGCFESDLAGYITFVNDAGCRKFGYSREEFIGLNNRQYTSPETARKAYNIFTEIYQTGIPAKIFDYEVIDREGAPRFMDMSVSLMHDASGKPVGFRGTSRDVTERKAIEAEKDRLTEQLNKARKLEAVGTLAGGIAHDFNNLLMGIQGYASLMMLDLDPAHPHFERLKAIEGQIKIGAELTKQLLGYAQGGRYEIVSINLNELLSKTSVLFGRKRQNIRIHHHYARQLWLVEGDQTQIEQVLLSLFMNASEAMPGGGTLFLETANVQLDESFVRPYSIKFGPYVKISVTDTGVGMDEKTKERIFEPFFTTKEMGRGVGLGLAPVYGIIKGHGGLIEVFSEKGEGTTFNIFLPASPKEI